MKIDPALLQAAAGFIGAMAAFLGGLYVVVTKPLLKRMDDIRADLAQFKTEVRADLKEIRTELKTHGERLTRVEERLPPPLVRH